MLLLAIREIPIIIHARFGILRTPPFMNIIRVATIYSSMVCNTAPLIARVGGFVPIFADVALVMGMIVVVVKALVSKVVHENFADLACWMGLICEVDDAVFDDVTVDAMDVICLFPTKHCVIAINVFNFEFTKLVSFDHGSLMLD